MEAEEQFLAACKQGDFAQFHKLVTEGADVNYKSGEALREAITNNHVSIWTLLLDCQDLDVKSKDENGRTFLHVACWYNKVCDCLINDLTCAYRLLGDCSVQAVEPPWQ